MATSSFIAFAALAISCLLLLHPRSVSGWTNGGATWYGPRNGAGTDGTYASAHPASMMMHEVHRS